MGAGRERRQERAAGGNKQQAGTHIHTHTCNAGASAGGGDAAAATAAACTDMLAQAQTDSTGTHAFVAITAQIERMFIEHLSFAGTCDAHVHEHLHLRKGVEAGFPVDRAFPQLTPNDVILPFFLSTLGYTALHRRIRPVRLHPPRPGQSWHQGKLLVGTWLLPGAVARSCCEGCCQLLPSLPRLWIGWQQQICRLPQLLPHPPIP